MTDSKAAFAISERKGLRLSFVFVAYIAQGLPVGFLFYSVPTWLAINDISALEIGAYVGMTSLPWTLKFVNGFIMDRFSYLPMGRRRAWLISAQILMIVGLVACAIVSPAPTSIAVLSFFGFAINVATTFQDVAVDGLAVDLLPDEERPQANGLMFGGQSVGIAIGTAAGGVLLATLGITVACLVLAALVGLVLAMIILVRERPGERLLPWMAGEASSEALSKTVDGWMPLFKSVLMAMIPRQSLFLCVALIASGFTYGIYLTLGPMIATQIGGWSDSAFSSFSGLNSLISGLAGIFVFGFMVQRLGTRLSAVIGYILVAVIALIMIVLRPQWVDPVTIGAFALAFFLLDLFIKVANCSTSMRFCDVKVAATQFTLYMALANLGMSLAGWLTGPIEGMGGLVALLAAMSVAGMIGAAATMFLLDDRPVRARLDPRID